MAFTLWLSAASVVGGLTAPLSSVCSPSTTHTLLVGPSRTYATLESALAAARALPFPRNVTISIARPQSMATPTLRLAVGIVLGAQDSCLVLRGENDQQKQRSSSNSTDDALDHIRLDSSVPRSLLERVSADDKRIAPSARGKVYRINLSSINATQHATRWPDTWTQGDPHTRNLGVFWNGRRLEYARFPRATVNATSLCPHVASGCENKNKGCVGGIAMAAALAGTSKDWTAGDHETPSVFQLYPETVPTFRRWRSALTRNALFLVGNWRVDFVFSGARVAALHLDDALNATVDFVAPISSGIGWKYDKRRSGCGCEPFFALNAIELIESPLDYALDFEEQAVYLYLPPSEVASGVLSVTDRGEPIVTITNDAHDITLEGIHLGFSFGDGVAILEGATNIVVVASSIHDVGSDAVVLSATGSTLRSSNIFRTGGGGVVVAANDDEAWQELRSSNITIRNNHIYDIGYRGIAFGIGVSLCNGTTGALVTHNLIHHVSGKGIHGGHRTSSGPASTYLNQGQFDNVVSYNEVFQVGLNGSGFGAIYSCCGPVDAAGTVFKYNFVHSSPGVNAIAWDNQLSGQRGFGNVIYYTQNGFGLNHGSFNAMSNNLIIANAGRGGITSFQAQAAISIACRGFSDVYNCSIPAFLPWEKQLVAARINDTTSPWGKRFKWYLGNICEEIATKDGKNDDVVGNLASTNAIVYIDTALKAEGCTDRPEQNNTFGNMWHLYRNGTVASSAASYDESDVVDPGFADYARLNFTLLPNSPIWKALPNWRAIPFNEMGLMVDGEYRTMVPTDAEVGRLALAPGTKGGPPLPKTKKMASSTPVPCFPSHASCNDTFGMNSTGCCAINDAEAICCQTHLVGPTGPIVPGNEGLVRSYCCPKGTKCSVRGCTPYRAPGYLCGPMQGKNCNVSYLCSSGPADWTATSALPAVLVIGDSVSDGWTPVLERKLKARYVTSHSPGAMVDGGARSTSNFVNCADYLLATDTLAPLPLRAADTVLINFGLHDYDRGSAAWLDEYSAEYEVGLAKLLARANGATVVVLGSTPVHNTGNESVLNDATVRALNVRAAALAKKHALAFVDLHTPLVSRCGPVPWADTGAKACPLCAPQCKSLSVHYDGAGYEVIAELIINATGLMMRYN